MRSLLFVTLILSIGALQAELTKVDSSNKNSFIYRDNDKQVDQKISITGYIPYGQIDNKLHLSCLNNQPVVENSVQLNIEIQHVQVIEFYNSSQPNYNNNIAYLIKTRNGIFFLYTQLTTSLQVASLNTVTANLLSSARFTALHFDSGAFASAIPVYSFPSAAQVPSMPGKALNDLRGLQLAYYQIC
ncbi:MAG: hypothetical protein ACR2PX_00645 [Endozoicomonas sp.]|uniref:hypothetical protein n=1 Tax=Endozoicomonas sp. TaxID=1892382 RepID=UPI003D9B2B11